MFCLSQFVHPSGTLDCVMTTNFVMDVPERGTAHLLSSRIPWLLADRDSLLRCGLWVTTRQRQQQQQRRRRERDKKVICVHQTIHAAIPVLPFAVSAGLIPCRGNTDHADHVGRRVLCEDPPSAALH